LHGNIIDYWLREIIPSSPRHRIHQSPNIIVPANLIKISSLWPHAIVFINRHAMKTSSKRLHTFFADSSLANNVIIYYIISSPSIRHVIMTMMVGHGRCVYYVIIYVNEHGGYKHTHLIAPVTPAFIKPFVSSTILLYTL